MTPMNKQRGFTLVEIAIVLVIIGLLLGGILKGQELITSARVRNIADQNSGVQAAYYGFIDRYRQIPGDMTKAAASAAIGSQLPATANDSGTAGNPGNGRIDTSDWAEASNVWAHLAAAQFIQGAYPGGATTEAAYAVAGTAPINAFNGYVLLGRSDDYQDASSTTVRLGLVLGDQIPVNVMRELDVKVDDGLPMTGVLRITDTAATDYGGISNTNAACIDTTVDPDIWNINGNEQDCNAMYLY